MPHDPLLVLDDDPTGTQSVAGVPVLLDWTDPAAIASAVDAGDGCGALYVLTNSRALDGESARATVASALRALATELRVNRIVLRGDSTLRGHVLEEYVGACDVLTSTQPPPYVVVPALPAAGRVTLGGVHYLDRGGRRERLDTTEYARDPVLGYRNSDLLTWTQERSNGFFPAASGRGLELDGLRSGGPSSVVHVLRELFRLAQPAVFAPDVETDADIGIIAAGLEAAAAEGMRPIIRCAPALAAALSGRAATRLADPPVSGSGVMVVCGSHVPTTTRQLDALRRAHPEVFVVADIDRLDQDLRASGEPETEIARLADRVGRLIAGAGLAVVATPRDVASGHSALSSSRRIAHNLALVLPALSTRPSVVISKGGITSAVIARTGLQARIATVDGPVASGIARWTVNDAADPTTLLVFPGNVGDDDALVRLVDLVMSSRSRA